MRKRIKTITEQTHEYGTIAIEHSLLDKLLGYASLDEMSTKHLATGISTITKHKRIFSSRICANIP